MSRYCWTQMSTTLCKHDKFLFVQAQFRAFRLALLHNESLISLVVTYTLQCTLTRLSSPPPPPTWMMPDAFTINFLNTNAKIPYSSPSSATSVTLSAERLCCKKRVYEIKSNFWLSCQKSKFCSNSVSNPMLIKSRFLRNFG